MANTSLPEPVRARDSPLQKTKMQFKQEHLKEEFFHLEATDPRLRAIVVELDFFFLKKFGRKLLATCVWRTEEEQLKLYPEFFARVGLTRPSPHLDRPCRSVDLRSKDLRPEEIEALRNYFQTWWEGFTNAAFLVNDRGNTFPHIHIQVGKKILVNSLPLIGEGREES